ncbi:hypothetical protein AWB98_28485 [Mycolicibacterium conceptionense]|uniref:Uncharacterized protein n=1 Tax=Mycolicibacterium conceptionense TaxID=451644 RepID=A0ABX3UYJ0_9MYCO|nr:hypothetical protein AWB98_28485 [Mycolicibacterium conceptionense]
MIAMHSVGSPHLLIRRVAAGCPGERAVLLLIAAAGVTLLGRDEVVGFAVVVALLFVFGVLWLFVDLLVLFLLLGLLLRRLLLYLFCRFLRGLLLGWQVVVGWLLSMDGGSGALGGIPCGAGLFARRHLGCGVVDVDAVGLRRSGHVGAGVAATAAGHTGWLELASPTRTKVGARSRAGTGAGAGARRPRIGPRLRHTERAISRQDTIRRREQLRDEANDNQNRNGPSIATCVQPHSESGDHQPHSSPISRLRAPFWDR